MNAPLVESFVNIATRKAPQDSLGFYLIDSESDSYLVGRIYRTKSEICDALRQLEIGATHWTSETRGFERFR